MDRTRTSLFVFFFWSGHFILHENPKCRTSGKYMNICNTFHIDHTCFRFLTNHIIVVGHHIHTYTAFAQMMCPEQDGGTPKPKLQENKLRPFIAAREREQFALFSQTIWSLLMVGSAPGTRTQLLSPFLAPRMWTGFYIHVKMELPHLGGAPWRCCSSSSQGLSWGGSLLEVSRHIAPGGGPEADPEPKKYWNRMSGFPSWASYLLGPWAGAVIPTVWNINFSHLLWEQKWSCHLCFPWSHLFVVIFPICVLSSRFCFRITLPLHPLVCQL